MIDTTSLTRIKASALLNYKLIACVAVVKYSVFFKLFESEAVKIKLHFNYY